MLQPIDLTNSKYSLGTTEIYNTLLREITREGYATEIVMLNLSTILRNCNTKESVKLAIEEDKRLNRESDTPTKVLLSETQNELSLLVQDVLELFNSNSMIMHPHLIIYHCDYAKLIPATYYRTPAPGKRVMTQSAARLTTQLGLKKRSSQQFGSVTVVELPIPPKVYPHVRLAGELGGIQNSHRTLHITHHPVDYHVSRYTSNYQLVQSFTGKTLAPAALGLKVFNTDILPFNVYTHALLGDPVDIKSVLPGKTKQQLLEVATTERWKTTHTTIWIKERLHDLGLNVPFNIPQ